MARVSDTYWHFSLFYKKEKQKNQNQKQSIHLKNRSRTWDGGAGKGEKEIDKEILKRTWDSGQVFRFLRPSSRFRGGVDRIRINFGSPSSLDYLLSGLALNIGKGHRMRKGGFAERIHDTATCASQDAQSDVLQSYV